MTVDRTKRFPCLDGWRAVSILIVLGSHCGHTGLPDSLVPTVWWLFSGKMGVRFFFVISGFLITSLLLQEYDRRGKISLRRFYARRALRILPVYYAFLLVVFALQHFTAWHQSGAAWLGNLTFTTNYLGDNWVTGHLWSLAVEEQFYVLWPILLVAIGCQNSKGLFIALALPVVVAPLVRVIGYTKTAPIILQPFFSEYSFLQHFDSLAVGCLAAVLLVRKEHLVSQALGRFKRGGVLLALVLIFTPHVLSRLLVAGMFTVPLGDSCQAIGFGMLILQGVLFPGGFAPLNWPVIRNLGVLSYSLYIWQQLFCASPKFFGWPDLWFMSMPGWLFAALLTAMLSYYCFEKPLLGLRARFRPVAA